MKWQNIDADDLPAAVKKSFDAMVEAEAAFKAADPVDLGLVCSLNCPGGNVTV